MGFMNSYKRLDNLCRDMNGKGVTGYIEDMESKFNTSFIPGWNDDYHKLKNYRYIRNQIAHENYANENNMCSDSDTQWIENFYERILNRTDPLAVYHKALNPRPASRPTAPKSAASETAQSSYESEDAFSYKPTASKPIAPKPTQSRNADKKGVYIYKGNIKPSRKHIIPKMIIAILVIIAALSILFAIVPLLSDLTANAAYCHNNTYCEVFRCPVFQRL